MAIRLTQGRALHSRIQRDIVPRDKGTHARTHAPIQAQVSSRPKCDLGMTWMMGTHKGPVVFQLGNRHGTNTRACGGYRQTDRQAG
jgi:hypothetical protein